MVRSFRRRSEASVSKHDAGRNVAKRRGPAAAQGWHKRGTCAVRQRGVSLASGGGTTAPLVQGDGPSTPTSPFGRVGSNARPAKSNVEDVVASVQESTQSGHADGVASRRALSQPHRCRRRSHRPATSPAGPRHVCRARATSLPLQLRGFCSMAAGTALADVGMDSGTTHRRMTATGPQLAEAETANDNSKATLSHSR
jgi:hypothetical protein